MVDVTQMFLQCSMLAPSQMAICGGGKMASRTSLRGLLDSRLGDASHSALDHLVSRDHQNKIALSITDWRSIAPFLGLEETDEEDIEVTYSTVKTRNIAMLRKWKHLHGSSATYRRLLEAFWTVERIDLIDKLLEMVAADTPPSPSKDNVETEDNEAMIYIKTLSGQRIVLEVIATDTVEDVKTMLQQKLPVEERVENRKLRLIFQGRELSDERLLCEYGIQNNSTVYQRLQTGTIQLCISLPDLGKFLPLTVKPATTFTDIIHRVVALERTLLPYQHLLVTLRGRSSVQLTVGKYVSVVGEYDLKSEDTLELTACKEYCHNLQVILPSHRNQEFSMLISQLTSDVITLRLHSHETFRTAETLLAQILNEQRRQYQYVARFYANEVRVRQDQLVGFVTKCYVRLVKVHHGVPQAGWYDGHAVAHAAVSALTCPDRFVNSNSCVADGYDVAGDGWYVGGFENERSPVFQVERRVGNRKVVSIRPSGSAVVYIDQNSTPLCLPDNDISISVIKELMKEQSPFPYYSRDRKVQLFQNDAKLTDDTILRECMSTETKYNGSSILTYHLTAEYSEEYCVLYYLDKPSKVLCDVQVLSTDTIADLKAAIEESSGIPPQNQALYDIYEPDTWYDVKYNLKLHDHQVVGDFVCYRRVYLDKRLLVIVKTPAGVTIPFEVLSCDDVLSLKRMITIETDIPVAAQTLLSDHTVLENTKSVGTYVGDGKLTLHCTLVVSS